MAVGLGGEQLWLSPTVANNVNPFDDQSGQGNNGTNNGSTVVADSASGGSYAYDFDGINDSIDCGNAIAPTTGYSASAWVNATAFPSSGNVGTIVQKGYDGTDEPFTLGLRDPTLLRSYTYDGAIHGNVYTHGMSTGTWYHVATTFDGATWRLFIDGVEVDAVSDSTALTQNSLNTYVGASWQVSYVSRFLNAKLDDVRIYDRAITQAEITHLASQRGIEGPPPVGLGDEKLWWAPSLSQSLTLDSSAYGKTVSSIGTAPTLIADTNAGGQYAGQIPTNGAVRVLDPVQFMTTGDCSTSGWIKASSSSHLTMTGQQIGGLPENKSGVEVDQFSGQNRAKFFDGVNNNGLYLQGGNTIPNNTWYHVATTKEGSTCKLFVNGVLLASGTKNGIPSNPDYKDLLIGGRWNGNNPSYGDGGYLDDVRLYSRAITQAEITHLATSRGVLGPPGGATHYNPFKSHAFTNNFQQRLR